jgi:predicted RND superfamily exporter protein
VASDAVGEQIDALKTILKKYDPNGMLIGEAPCTKDMVDVTDHDFRVVSLISVLAIFVIIMLVEKSLSLPFILVAVIELAIFINLGIPHYMGQSLPFIAPIVISTIQLGATVDYAILMTTRYKEERMHGLARRDAVWTALKTSIPSILVSGTGLFAATIGVAIYSDVDMISSMCVLLARGAVISMILVIFILPSMLMAFDGLIKRTTAGMKKCDTYSSSETRKELYV